ncbi:MAG TPA: hypothetical protein VMD92_02770 [Acidobacteriaceae bacterium]|nr:hypothetical protein [Acidobacteriaceae bacterium]
MAAKRLNRQVDAKNADRALEEALFTGGTFNRQLLGAGTLGPTEP